jgi:predicted glycoside hydrolase/deacetylase ChbG (UPF0249 family)
MKKLIVNADDFGLTEGINRGIIDGFKDGIITSASLIPTMPAFEHAVKLAMANPDLDIGVHLSLTVGKPCSNSNRLSSILQQGEFIRSYVSVIRSICVNRVDIEDIKNEMSRQIRKVQEVGLKVSHVDSHQHIHMVPHIFGLLLELMKEHEVPFLRIPDELVSTRMLLTIKGWGLFILGLAGKVSRRKAVRAGVSTAQRFRGLFCSESMSLRDLTHVLESLEPGISELMCHPGYNDDALGSIYHKPSFREEELAALTHQETRELVRQRGIRLINYTALLNYQ